MDTNGQHDGRRVFVAGASAGGVEALKELVAGLPQQFPGALLVVLHVSASATSVLPDILRRAGHLPVDAAEDGAPLPFGGIAVAPPDRHLLVAGGHLRLTRAPRENGHRPAIDPLFRSVADLFGERSCGIVLSGTRDDGTEGLAHIRRAGGLAFVQDPEDALYAGMPTSALQNVGADEVLRAADMGPALLRFAQDGTRAHSLAPTAPLTPPREARLSGLVCPDCGGATHERDAAGTVRFTCHAGHEYAPDSMLALQGAAVERALWTAVRSLEDRGTMLQRMAGFADERGHRTSAERFRRQAAEAQRQAVAIRQASSRDSDHAVDEHGGMTRARA